MSASIDDVAVAAGVSTATVSRAIRGLAGVAAPTRSRVLTAAGKLGYVPSSSASGLASGRTMTIGVVVPMIERWFFAAALEGVDRELRAAGYDLMVFNLGGHGANRERVFHRSLLRKRIDALVMMCMALTAEELLSLHAVNSPTLVIGGQIQGIRHVSIDDAAATRGAVEHLISLGHRNIIHLQGGSQYGVDFAVPRIRNQTFRRILRSHGLTPSPPLSGGFRIDSSKDAVGRLFDSGVVRPTAIFASSDEMAHGALYAAAQRGIRVPQDLSVIGIDDHEFSAAAGLSTIRQVPEDQGAYGTRVLLAELAGGGRLEVPAVQPHQLVIRASTAPPS